MIAAPAMSCRKRTQTSSARRSNACTTVAREYTSRSEEKGCERIPSPAVPVKSRVGAGDSMVAGIVLGLARDMPVRDAVGFGIASGAAAVMMPGTQLCRREDAERLFMQMIQTS
jgi:fructose-1-phosphate kinase PfkB-like protein